MGLREAVLGALDERKRLREARAEWQRRHDRATALSPETIAERIANGELVEPVLRMWARRVPVEESTKLAADIASLGERDGRPISKADEDNSVLEAQSAVYDTRVLA